MLPAENVKAVLLACFDYLERREVSQNLTELEVLAFAALYPDLDEAWATYEQRVASGKNGGRPKKETIRYHTVNNKPYGTEEEPEPEEEKEPDQTYQSGGVGAAAGCLAVPCLDDVLSFASECGASDELARSFFETNRVRNWSIEGKPIRDWRKLFRSWLEHERKQPAKASLYTEQDYADSAKYCLC